MKFCLILTNITEKRHMKLLPYEIRTLEKLQNSIRNGLRMKRDGFILHHHNGGEIQEGTVFGFYKKNSCFKQFIIYIS